MKYFAYSALWKLKGEDCFRNSLSDVHECTSVTKLYEHVQQQPEQWCITSVVEITEDEYIECKGRGIIG